MHIIFLCDSLLIHSIFFPPSHALDLAYALNNTDMDHVVIEDYLFTKREVQ